MKKKISLLLITLPMLFWGCKCQKNANSGTEKNVVMEEVVQADSDIDDTEVTGSTLLAPAVVYKTTKDYSKNVPVILTPDKKSIASYPAPTDVYYRGNLAYPTPLIDGYWLDNRGINEHVAFTSYTYEEYSRLKETPSKETLMKKVIDKYPLLNIVNCGARTRYKDEVRELNEVIKGGFKGFNPTYDYLPIIL